MATMDRLILWGALAVMAAVGSLSAWKISGTPDIEPEIVRLEQQLVAAQNNPNVTDPPPPVPRVRIPNEVFPPVKTSPSYDWAAFIRPREVVNVEPPVRRIYPILPFAVPAQAKADLHGITVTWELENRPVDLKPYQERKESKPSLFIIERQCEDGQVEELARVGAKERSYVDLSTEPRLTYRYWVVVKGDEASLDSYPPMIEETSKGLHLSVEARTPSATRVKLVGGDKENAILRVETYDRAQKKWLSRMTRVGPGSTVGGWTLRALRFDNFTLVAHLTDDDGVERVLTTKD
jgi:hypothetical protein